MIQLTIDQGLKKSSPLLALGAVQATVSVTRNDSNLWKEIDTLARRLSRELTAESLYLRPGVRALRDAYRSIGKDPTRYRGSAEALVRRIIQGKGLYRVNTIVDINNYVSMSSLHSVGSYDIDQLQAPCVFRIGKPGESYKGIGKEIINIAELPVFADNLGAYGSPTSDSERAMIRDTTKHVLIVVISFTGTDGLPDTVDQTADLLKRYASAGEMETAIIE